MRTMEELGFRGTYTPIEDGRYVAQVVEVPGAVTQGETLEGARENVRDAARELLEARREKAGELLEGRGDVILEPLATEEAERREVPGGKELRRRIGAAVRERRAELGISQQALSLRASLNRNYVTEVETARRNIGVENAARLAAALDLSLTDLFRRAGL